MSKRVIEIVPYVEREYWYDIKKWIETRMSDTIVWRDFSFDIPVFEWPSFDDIVYMTFLNYIENSWLRKHMIQIEVLKHYYKSFYCNLMREPMKKAVLEFIDIHNDDRISPGLFGDLFIKNIFPEYMRNNVFFGHYLTHTNNIAVTPFTGTLFVIKNNGVHENGMNRRRVFVHYKNRWSTEREIFLFQPLMEYEPDELHLLKLGTGDDDVDAEGDSIEIVSIVNGEWNSLFVLDTKGRLYKIRVIIPPEPDNPFVFSFGLTLDGSIRYTKALIEEYWDIKTSIFMPLSQLKIIGIYRNNSFHIDDFQNEEVLLLTDTGELYGNYHRIAHRKYAFAHIPLPSEAKKIVLLNGASEYFIVAIDSNNACFVARKRNFPNGVPIFSYLYTFKQPIILINFVSEYNGEKVVLVTESNDMIGIHFFNNSNNTGKKLPYIEKLRPSLWTEFPNNNYEIEPNFSLHILMFSNNSMLVMDNETKKPTLLYIPGLTHMLSSESTSDITGGDMINLVRQNIIHWSKEDVVINDFILSACISKYNNVTTAFILLASQKIIRVIVGEDSTAEVMSTRKEFENWKFECTYCGRGTNMVDPLRLIALCSEKCCDNTK